MSHRSEDRMLCLSYLGHELRHRWWQALATAAGLTVGVALVVTVSAAAAGTSAAQSRVLDSLDHAVSSNAAASTIGGAVATTSGLAANLGTWVAVAALAASFTIAVLLTLASLSRRVREFGTLKALGWSARRITAQVFAETATVGIAGTLAGVVLGYAGAALVSVWAPTLTVNVTELPGAISSSHSPAGTQGVPVHFSAQVSLGIVALAIALGILGTLLAAALGAWRAARLGPSVALTKTG